MKKSNTKDKNLNSDLEYALKLNRWLLKPLGIWPLYSSSTKFERITSLISPPICCFLLLCVMISSFVEMFVSEKDLKSKLEILGPTSFFLMGIIKYFVFITRGEKVKLCIDTIVNDWRNVRETKERETMIRNVKIARLFAIICVCFMYGAGVFYSTLLPVITAKSLSRDNNLTVRILPFRCNFIFFDPYVRPIFDIVYIVQCLCSVILYSITTGVCSLAAKFVMHACGQCEIVISLLRNLIDDDRDFTCIVKKKLDLVILRHLHVIRFVTNVKDLLNEICLVEFLGCTMNMCLLGYYFMTGWKSESALRLVILFFLLASVTFNIFIFCYIGEMLTNHCHQIGEASYIVDWYRLPGTQARFFILLIGIANRPMKLTAGKMFQLSFTCFGKVIKAAVAYLNILRTVTA